MAMKKVCFTLDSASDLPEALLFRYADIEIVPLHILLGDDSFEDGVNIRPEDVIRYVDETGDLPKTSAVAVAEYSDVFGRLTGAGCAVVHIALSSGISSSCQNALVAAADYDNVFVVDSELLSSGMALLLIKGCEMRKRGASAKEIADALQILKKNIITSFIIDKLDYLKKGGRCSGAAAFGANILGIKPCIGMHDGVLSVGKKYRGKLSQCQITYVGDILSEAGEIDTSVCILDYTPGVSSEQEQTLKQEIFKCHPFTEILIAHPGCTITSHCGPDTMAVFFMKK